MNDRKVKGMIPVHSSLAEIAPLGSDILRIASPCPVDVIIHVVRIHSETGHVVLNYLPGLVLLVLAYNGH